MKLTNIQAYIFDVDDTLYDESEYVAKAMKNVADYVEDKCKKKSKTVYNYCMELLEKEGRGHIFDNLIEKFGLDLQVAELVKVYRDTKSSLSLYPDAKELLDTLKKEGFKIGIITDGNAGVQNAKVEGLGLNDICDAIILTDLYKEDGKSLSKPDKRVYELCLEKLEVAPENAVYIGDNPLKDFVGAKKLGMKTVQICRDKGMFMQENAPSTEFEADYKVNSLIELK